MFPRLLKEEYHLWPSSILENTGKAIEDIRFFAIHPGGKKILESIEQELGINPDLNEAAYYVLRNFGNMSSPTVLFVLGRVMEKLSDKDKNDSVLEFRLRTRTHARKHVISSGGCLTMSSFSTRSTDPEIMDDLKYAGSMMDQTLKELEVINRWLGGNDVTLRALSQIVEGKAHKSLDIADLGCGRGDMLRHIPALGQPEKYNCYTYRNRRQSLYH
ncbi:MAG: 3-oxoacyl-[acyl-carrier-protein] synthase III C-terminal domain-containing protein [Chryseolinea sp.]